MTTPADAGRTRPAYLGRFRVRWDRLLGRGSYWSVYAAWDPRTGEQAAIKIQSDRTREDGMILEGAFLQRLRGSRGVPALLDWGTESGYRFLALERLGSSIQQLADRLGGTLTLPTVLRLGVVLVNRLSAIHRLGVLHRDVKPENLLVGSPFGSRRDAVYLVDYGFAKQFDPRASALRVSAPPSRKKRFVGTPLFAPLAAHEGIEMSEKDDLESAIYTLVHLYYGMLPWTTKPGEPSPTVGTEEGDWFAKIAECKRSSDPGDLVLGSSWLTKDHPKTRLSLPTCFATALRYVQCGACRSGRLDYAFLADLFWKQLEQIGETKRAWDWNRRR
jgi:serine/threonine protein kinase